MKPKTDTESVNDKQPDGGSGLLGGLLGGLFSKPTQNQVNQNVSFTHNIFHTLSDTLWTHHKPHKHTLWKPH